MPLSEKLGLAVAEAGVELAKLISRFAEFVRDEGNRKQIILGGSILVLVLVTLTSNPISNGVGRLFQSDPGAPQLTPNGSPDFARYEDVFLGEEGGFVVTGTANVRNFPTGKGTTVIRTLQEGETIAAREVQAFDPDSAWYKLSDGGYIWGGNIDRYDEMVVDRAATFPRNLQGRWSSMDSCRGGLDAIVEVSDRTIRINETLGQLRRVSHDARGRDEYHIDFVAVDDEWSQVSRIYRSANGLSLTIEDVANSNQPTGYFHNPGVGCQPEFLID